MPLSFKWLRFTTGRKILYGVFFLLVQNFNNASFIVVHKWVSAVGFLLSKFCRAYKQSHRVCFYCVCVCLRAAKTETLSALQFKCNFLFVACFFILSRAQTCQAIFMRNRSAIVWLVRWTFSKSRNYETHFERTTNRWQILEKMNRMRLGLVIRLLP